MNYSHALQEFNCNPPAGSRSSCRLSDHNDQLEIRKAAPQMASQPITAKSNFFVNGFDPLEEERLNNQTTELGTTETH